MLIKKRKIAMMCGILTMVGMLFCGCDEKNDIENENINISEKEHIDNLKKQINEAKCVSEYQDDANVDDFDTVKLGKYEQDGNIKNGKEDIEWIVVEKTNDKVLLFSKYVLDYRIYGRNCAWNESEIRYYLNNDFIDNSFNDVEKKCIVDTDLITNKHLCFDDNGEPYYTEIDTKDKIFIFSKEEMLDKFNFKNDTTYGYYSTQVKTKYIKNIINKEYKYFDYFFGTDEIIKVEDEEEVIYWLRDYTPSDPAWDDCQNDVDDPDNIRTFVFYVEDGGLTSDMHSYCCSWDILGVRPAMWVSIE